jgi:AbrB family looped-hinge helix DNA binding protein
MAAVRIGPKHQITIPGEAFERLGLQPGDMLDIEVRDGVMYAVPQRLVPRDQAWFWTAEWQQMEREADEAIASGELSGPFDSVEELQRHLRRRET